MDNDTRVDPAVVDKTYKPFPGFGLWTSLRVDNEQWARASNDLKESGAKDPQLLAKARDVAKRAAAIDTGALEGLYTIDSGFTITVAMQVGVWRALYEKEKEETRKIIESQLAGYDQVIDFATRQTPLLEVWLRGFRLGHPTPHNPAPSAWLLRLGWLLAGWSIETPATNHGFFGSAVGRFAPACKMSENLQNYRDEYPVGDLR